MSKRFSILAAALVASGRSHFDDLHSTARAPACSNSRQGKSTTCRSRREAGSSSPTRTKDCWEASMRIHAIRANDSLAP